ncbi:MAG: rRNA ((1618)-N(6))-methyltransferase [Mucilaginibacter sp.]|uniref:23S rRNA (adenine(1618)-N(6))-methyltransferase RlmF n=1 Tax=Mucilaginibacter sp. TaxID=1882438 RepID=UPI00263369E0|nr:23S rRNA (adenine(1618)-N(6))-methyltransferase RlmF [Mucilaginibacter sp.]MDB5003639.1 rRNA ((1618)-N(6))-methyltransferase [Mucilaginibacter sp.]
MNTNQPQKPAEKENMHPRNSHRGGYDFKLLCKADPELKNFVGVNKHDVETIDFSDPQAVKELNKALLKHYYGVDGWDIPEGYLCPPIPGRADYVHYIADLLKEVNGSKIQNGNKINVLDIGMGANCVYPLIGNAVYKWQFTGTDIDPVAIRSAKDIIGLNKGLQNQISFRLQTGKDNVFVGAIKPDDRFDLTMCNPPFHGSFKEAQDVTATKWKKLGVMKKPTLLNFGGQKNELWCNGGEVGFIRRMVAESAQFAKQCLWFTTLVSKKDTLPAAYNALKWNKALDVKTINMAHGQKTTRIIAWTFLTPEEQTNWKNKYWK